MRRGRSRRARVGRSGVRQQPAEQRRVDSLAAECGAQGPARQLARAVGGDAPGRRPQADTTQSTSGDAARRRRGRAGTDTARMRSDTATPTKFVGRERSQPQLNPEISATGECGVRHHAGCANGQLRAREFEVGFQSPLDPIEYQIFVSFENAMSASRRGMRTGPAPGQSASTSANFANSSAS